MKRLSLFLTGILVIAVGMSGCNYFNGSPQGPQAQGKDGKPGMGKPEKPKFKIPITAERVERGRMYAYLQAVGTVIPIMELEMKPEMTGRIYYTKKWMEGDEVKKGDVLATIDDRQVNNDINEAQLQLDLSIAAVRPADAQLAQAKKDEEFKKTMYERGAISKAEYDLATLTRIQRENQYEQAKKNIESRRMALQKFQQESEKISIVLPFAGVLLPAQQSVSTNTRNTENSNADLTLLNGQTVGANQILCRLANIDKVYIALDVPAKDLVQVEVGQDVELEIYSRTGSEYKGIVADISTALNSNTRTYTVNVLVENPLHELRPGMFAKARIITEEKLDAVSIPRSMVQLRNNRDVVFVVKPKPQGEIRNATGEANPDVPMFEQSRQNKQLVMAGHSDNVAFAGEEIGGATADFDPPVDPNASPAGGKPEELEMVAEERVITKGIENRDDVEVVEGLREGDLLVVLGHETLTDGVDVNVTIRDKSLVDK